MSESEEANHLLDDESMDEVHELEDALLVSVDTNASPTKPKQRSGENEDDDDDSSSGLSDLDENSDSSEGEESDDTKTPTRTKKVVGAPAKHKDDSSSESDDEPPEIPGSPLRNASPEKRGATTTHTQRKADVFEVRHTDGSDDEYEHKDTLQEQPRSMQIHGSESGSSSSESGSDSGSDSDLKSHKQSTARPKTAAATDIHNYRDLIPNEYLEKKIPVTSIAEPSSQSTTNTTKHKSKKGASDAVSTRPQFKMRVPKEIEDLFQYVSLYTPEPVELPMRLEPFLPEFTPSIGLPFDGIQIPRPDGKPDDVTGIQLVREPSAQSNVAELELLLRATQQHKLKEQRLATGPVVHSIQDAVHRPREIEQWIQSVAKVHATKPLPQVLYRKPMPSLIELMELWPEEMERVLSETTPPRISEMALSLKELTQVVCTILDIPVYPGDGQYVLSLHVLFSLYNEMIMYEKERKFP